MDYMELIVSQIEQLKLWTVTALPLIIIYSVIFAVLLRFIKLLTKQVSNVLIRRQASSENNARMEAEKRINTLTRILSLSLRIAIITIYLMIILGKVGIELAPLLAGAGIAGLAIGFGAQELVRDVITGFFILLEDQIRVGDVVNINGTGGLVEKIELRTVRLRDLSGSVHFFQNGKINTLTNLTKEWSATVLDIGVAYKEDVQKVIDVMKAVGDTMINDEAYAANFVEPIEVFGLDRFDDSALIIKARIKTMPGKQWVIGREYRKRLKVAFDEQGIEIPFPHTTIYWGEKIAPLAINMDSKVPANAASAN